MMQQNRRMALFVAAAVVCLTAPPATAAEKPAPKATASALEMVPADAMLVIAIRVGDYWDHPLNKASRTVVENGTPEPYQTIRAYFGVGPEEVDQLIVFCPVEYGTNSAEPLFVVKTIKPYDKKTVLGPDAAEEEINDRTLYRNKRGVGFTFLDDHTFVLGHAGKLTALLKRKKAAKDGPLTPALKLAAEKHYTVVGLNMPAMEAMAPAENLPPELKPFKPLLRAKLATLTVDLDDQLRAVAKADFANEADAKAGAAAVDDALDLVRGAFVQGVKQFSQDVDAPKTVALLKEVQAILRAVKAEQKGATVEVEAALKIDPTTAAAVAEAAVKVREAARRLQIGNDFKQLALAVHSFADVNNGQMPAAAIYDKNGKPLLSWRVTLLPYIEGGQLYSQFHLDEPWDSEHNKKLLEKMPEVFAPKDSEAYKKHETSFQAFVGKGTMFEPPAGPRPGLLGNGLRFPTDIPDGLSNTILFVEARKAVPWTKPDDVPFDEGKLLPKVGDLNKGGFFAAIGDGSVRFLPFTVKEKNLRIWIIRNSGQPRPALDE